MIDNGKKMKIPDSKIQEIPVAMFLKTETEVIMVTIKSPIITKILQATMDMVNLVKLTALLSPGFKVQLKGTIWPPFVVAIGASR